MTDLLSVLVHVLWAIIHTTAGSCGQWAVVIAPFPRLWMLGSPDIWLLVCTIDAWACFYRLKSICMLAPLGIRTCVQKHTSGWVPVIRHKHVWLYLGSNIAALTPGDGLVAFGLFPLCMQEMRSLPRKIEIFLQWYWGLFGVNDCKGSPNFMWTLSWEPFCFASAWGNEETWEELSLDIFKAINQHLHSNKLLQSCSCTQSLSKSCPHSQLNWAYQCLCL